MKKKILEIKMNCDNCGAALFYKYYDEKIGQCRCGKCGVVVDGE